MLAHTEQSNNKFNYQVINENDEGVQSKGKITELYHQKTEVVLLTILNVIPLSDFPLDSIASHVHCLIFQSFLFHPLTLTHSLSLPLFFLHSPFAIYLFDWGHNRFNFIGFFIWPKQMQNFHFSKPFAAVAMNFQLYVKNALMLISMHRVRVKLNKAYFIVNICRLFVQLSINHISLAYHHHFRS